jgi:hypothetical protein
MAALIERPPIGSGVAAPPNNAVAPSSETWKCSGIVPVSVPTRAGDIVKLQLEIVIADTPSSIDELYSFDPVTERVATPRLANARMFDGTVPRGDRQASLSVVTATVGANAIHRGSQRPDDDVWNTFHGDTSRRT